jgi:peptidoglycan/LPS O-acetylase OafA/YrhL
LSVKHIPQLDGIRAVAIGAVLLTHLWGYPAGHWLNGFAQAGWVGVDLFFALSGFLITGILRDTRDDPSHFKNFYARRTLRIFPLYYALLILTLVLLPQFKEIPADAKAVGWMYWAYLGNFATTDNWHWFPLDITWSLSIEEQFYLIWPALIYRMSNKRVLQLCIGLMVAMPLVRLALYEPLGWRWLTMVFRADAFAAGAATAVLMRMGVDVSRIKWASLLWLPLIALAWKGSLLREKEFVSTFGYTLTSVASVGLIVLAMQTKFFANKVIAYVGKISYGVYIYHPLCLVALSLVYPATNTWAQLALGTILSVAVASASFWLYETPILKLKRYFAGAESVKPVSVIASVI